MAPSPKVRVCRSLRLYTGLLCAFALRAATLEQAIELEKQGKQQEAAVAYREAADAARNNHDNAALTRAQGRASWVSLSLGKYRDAIAQASESVAIKPTAEVLNTAALAHQNLGEYAQALGYFRKAQAEDAKNANPQGEVSELTNIANVYYFQGLYPDALRTYQEARGLLEKHVAEPWAARLNQATLANLAVFEQRIGRERPALDLYKQLGAAASLTARERAQIVQNQGTLYRHWATL